MSKKPEMSKRPPVNPRVLGRVLKMLFRYYPVLVPVAIACILVSAVTAALPAIFMQQVIAAIEEAQLSGLSWSAAAGEIVPKVILLGVFYVISWVAIILQTQLMAVITQGFLYKLRRTMFDKMQDLSIRYFDTHKHGDIMSHYTNDIDALRDAVLQPLDDAGASCRRGGNGAGLQKDRRRLCQILYASAAYRRPCRGLCAGNDERPEGH